MPGAGSFALGLSHVSTLSDSKARCNPSTPAISPFAGLLHHAVTLGAHIRALGFDFFGLALLHSIDSDDGQLL